MTKNGVIVLIIAAVIFTVIGFFIGQIASALIDPPGSDSDPLVSQSYVEALVGERTAALQTQLEELKATVEELTAGGSNPTGGDATDPSDNDPDDTPDVTTPTYSKVKVTASSVNLRASASTSATKVGTAVKGDTFKYVETVTDSAGDKWYKITLSSGTTAFIYASLASLVE